MQLRRDQEQEILKTISIAAPDGIDFGEINVKFVLKNGGICDISVQTNRKLPPIKNTH
jgi:hypothetical protein